MTNQRAIYSVRQLPLFQNRVYRTAEEAVNCKRGDVLLAQDLGTGLIFNSAFRPELMKYDADYQNEQAVSSIFQRHLDEVMDLVGRHFRGRSLIEVGCGKGYFLEYLQAHGFDVTGIDPAYEGVNPKVRKGYFNSEAGLQAEGVILRHVLEHIENPVSFLKEVSRANGGRGTIYLEVPSFDWICQHCAWFDVFYEHVNYFRLGDFSRLFGRIHDAGTLFGGQYLYVIADLSTIQNPAQASVDPFDFPTQFTASVARYGELIRGKRNRAVVWGGSSKGVTFALFMQRAGAQLDCVVDINPAKQGRFLPATGLRVWSPAEMLETMPPGADIYVMNGNYLSEIKTAAGDRFTYTVVDEGSPSPPT